ncbi:MAG: nitroreductase family protein [Acidimicrobiales bacterium]|jgi:nitroreductase
MPPEQPRLDPPAELDMAVGYAMFTQRAIRRLDSERPISDDVLKLVIDAASKAPSGGNTQPARLVVLRDRSVIEEFGGLYYEAWWAKRRGELGWEPGHDIPTDSPYRMASVLASEMVSAPVVVLGYTPPGVPGGALSVLPGIQNMMLAARSVGIGSVLTTLHPQVMDRVNELVGAPVGAEFHCCVPLGYPRGGFGTTQRRPTNETTYWNTWGHNAPWGSA